MWKIRRTNEGLKKNFHVFFTLLKFHSTHLLHWYRYDHKDFPVNPLHAAPFSVSLLSGWFTNRHRVPTSIDGQQEQSRFSRCLHLHTGSPWQNGKPKLTLRMFPLKYNNCLSNNRLPAIDSDAVCCFDNAGIRSYLWSLRQQNIVIFIYEQNRNSRMNAKARMQQTQLLHQNIANF